MRLQSLPRQRARLKIEDLEERSLPSSNPLFGEKPEPQTNVRAVGKLLIINGNDGDNQIAILHDANGVTVAKDGGPRALFAGIEAIAIRTAGGNDSVEYVAEIGLLRPADLRVNLGNGDDQVTIVSQVNKHTPRPWRLDIDAGAGMDGISIQGPNVPGDETSVPIYMELTARTGAGDDQVSLSDFSFDPPDPLGGGDSHRISIDTGAGADELVAQRVFFNEQAGVRFDMGSGGDVVTLSEFNMSGGDCVIKL